MTSSRKTPRGQARPAGQAARETGATTDATTPTGAELRAMRERRGLTQGAAARHLAASTGLSADAWRVALSDYERGRRRPEAARLAALRALYSPEPDDACRQDVSEALRDVPRLVERHGSDRVSMALREYAALVILAGAMHRKMYLTPRSDS